VPLKLTSHERKVLAVIAILLALGLLGMALLHGEPAAEPRAPFVPPGAILR